MSFSYDTAFMNICNLKSTVQLSDNHLVEVTLYPAGNSTQLNKQDHPNENETCFTFIILPAMGIRATYYNNLALALQNKGHNTITMDLRGHGKSSLRASRKVDFNYEDLVEDLNKICEKSKEWFPDTKLILIGHSLGGQIASLYTAKNPQMIESLILIACGLPYWKGWSGVEGLLVKTAGYIFYPISILVGHFPGYYLNFGGREASSLIKDWSGIVRTGNFDKIKTSFDYKAALKKIDIPIVSISFENDWLATEKSVDLLLSKFHTSRSVIRRHLTSNNLSLPVLDHFKWVKAGDLITEEILQNLNKVDVY